MSQTDSQRYRNDPGDRITDDQRKLLKEKTGFDSYTSYLRDYNKNYPGYTSVLLTWKRLDVAESTSSTRYDCHIFDLIKHGNSSISFDRPCRTNSYSELFTALAKPRENVYGRIMIWRKPKRHNDHTAFIEDLGPALDISPAFFKSVYETSFEEFARNSHIPVTPPRHVVIGETVATMTTCRLSEESKQIPIVLIVDTSDPDLNPYERHNGFQWPMVPDWPFSYVQIIMGIIERNLNFSKSAKTLILPALLAAIQHEAWNLRDSCDYGLPNNTDRGNGDPIEAITTTRTELRKRIEAFENILQDARTCFSSLYGANWSRRYNCESTIGFFLQSIDRARRFEAAIRDSCQVKVGQLALKESKKSIELSRVSIAEGKKSCELSVINIEEGKRGESHVNCIRRLSLISPSQNM